MRLIGTTKPCPKCEQVLDIVLEVPYFKRVVKSKQKKNAKSPTIMDATGFVCSFCDSKWTLDDVLNYGDSE